MCFANLAGGNDGRAACVRAQTAPALVALAELPAVATNADAAWNVARALLALAESDDGRAACVAAGAAPALEALAAQPAVQANEVVAAALGEALKTLRAQACCAVC